MGNIFRNQGVIIGYYQYVNWFIPLVHCLLICTSGRVFPFHQAIHPFIHHLLPHIHSQVAGSTVSADSQISQSPSPANPVAPPDVSSPAERQSLSSMSSKLFLEVGPFELCSINFELYIFEADYFSILSLDVFSAEKYNTILEISWAIVIKSVNIQ